MQTRAVLCIAAFVLLASAANARPDRSFAVVPPMLADTRAGPLANPRGTDFNSVVDRISESVNLNLAKYQQAKPQLPADPQAALHKTLDDLAAVRPREVFATPLKTAYVPTGIPDFTR